MPTTITPLNKFTTPITVPVDGDPVTFAQREPSLQALADRTLWNQGKSRALRNMLLRSKTLAQTIPANAVYLSTNYCVWAPQLALFVGVGTGNTTQRAIVTSPDGDVWTQRTNPNDAGPSAQAFIRIVNSAAIGVLVAIGSGGAGVSPVIRSVNGTTWTSPTAPLGPTWSDIARSETIGLFVAVASSLGGGAAQMMKSADGTTWTNVTIPAQAWADIDFSPEIGKFVVVGPSAQALYSSDAITWSAGSMPASSGAYSEVIHSAALGMFLAYGVSDLATSTDGITWTHFAKPAALTSSFKGAIVWSEELSCFIGYGSTTNAMAYSEDGTTWVSIGGNALPNSTCMAWSPELLRLVWVSGSNTTSGILRST